MDIKRLLLFISISLIVLLLWNKYVYPSQSANNANHVVVSSNNNTIDGTINNLNHSQSGKTILVTTDLMQAKINTIGGDIYSINLLNHSTDHDHAQPFTLLQDTQDHVFVTQTGLVSNQDISLPGAHTLYDTTSLNYVLNPNQDTLLIHLNTTVNGISVVKTYTFKRNSYVVNVTYQVTNLMPKDLSQLSLYWSLLRDDKSSGHEARFVRTFTGPVYYSDDSKFQKVKFSNLEDNDVSYPSAISNGWVGYIQHYFAALWLLNANGYTPTCSTGFVSCRLSIRHMMSNGLFSVGLLTDLPNIAAHSSIQVSMPLFVGPEEYSVITKVAPHLELIKDYGWVYIFATPLFWLLLQIFNILHNWGYAIILLTIVVKLVLYPLTRASYISMAKMKALAPKLEQLKSQYGDDKVKLQGAMMELYKSEKVNPLGGCLPMVLQIPVFLGLYWALLASVELRHASFLWIHDLSISDPYYILPILLAVSMFGQTFLNPAPTDPLQAKMMRFMPLAFSFMFFFFPAGLVLYWLVNNILSMSQQWYVNNHVTLKHKIRKSKK